MRDVGKTGIADARDGVGIAERGEFREVRKYGITKNVRDSVSPLALPGLMYVLGIRCLDEVKALGYAPIEKPKIKVVENILYGEWEDEFGILQGVPRRKIIATVRCVMLTPGESLGTDTGELPAGLRWGIGDRDTG